MTRVHIHARDITLFDAVGNFVRQLAKLLVDAGYEPMLWAENYSQAGLFTVRHRSEFWNSVGADDVIVFNHSIFDPFLPLIAALPQRKVLYFHNVTRPELIDPANPETIENCRKGLEQLEIFPQFDVLIANSTATLELVRDTLGSMTPPAEVAAPVIGLDRFGVHSPTRQFSAPALLCVGRLVPHKRVVEVVALFKALMPEFPAMELHFVGGPSGGPYVEALRARASTVSPLIRFFHDVSDAELAELYCGATACISLSAHEGFCVPALDALFFDKPFFCTPIPSVEEMLGEAALVLPDAYQDAAIVISNFLRDPQRNVSHAVLRSRRRAEWRELASGAPILNSLARIQH